MKPIPTIKEGLAEWASPEPQPEPVAALKRAANALREAGIDLGDRCWWKPADAILIAEAVNWAAKVIDWSFYDLKPDCVAEAVRLGADGGFGQDGCYYLYDPSVGTASFHDPFGEIADALGDDIQAWPFPWSGVQRQDMAFVLMTNRKELLRYKFATAPGPLGDWCRTWMFQPKPQGRLP